MTPDLTFFAALFASSIAIALMFVPALTELKKPYDAGPRLITDDFIQKMLGTLKTQIINIEDGWKTDNQPSVRNTLFFDFIPNLEA